ncbi:MAG: glycosyltransferase family 39 protein [Aureispira sp.]|nr:glycosyltransferase family 39 protein [Aureispira sp.]
MQTHQHTYKYPALLTLIWLVGIFLVGVGGDFPLNDDWAYAHNVYHLSEHNTLKFSDWPAMTLLAQMYWGALFCKIFGFSFVVLRISTLILGWIGLLTFYQLLWEQSKHAHFAFLGSLLLLFNPLFFSLSYTFMTDVPFLSVTILSLLYYNRSLGTEHWKSIAAGTLFAIIAILIRQLGAVIPLFFMAAYIHKKGINVRSISVALTPLILIIVLQQLITWWRVTYFGVPTHFGKLEQLLGGIWNGYFFRNLTWRPGTLLFYCGYFLLPISLLLAPYLWKASKTLHKGIALITIVLFLLCYFPVWNMLPNGNIFYDFGLGPKVLKDAFVGENIRPQLPNIGWIIVKVIGFFAACLFLLTVVLNHFQGRATKAYLGNWTTILGYAVFLMITPFFFDRYYLFLYPFLVSLVIPKKLEVISPIWWRISASSILIYALFSIGLTHDYMSWNTVRWQALEELMEKDKISPNRIDGGFEFNGWYQTSDERGETKRDAPSWWFVDQDDYVVSFGPTLGFLTYKTYPYQNWLPYRTDSIYILQKPILTTTDTIFCNTEHRTGDSTLTATSLNGPLEMEKGFLRDSSKAFSHKFSLQLTPQDAFGYTSSIPNMKASERLLVSIWRHQDGPKGYLVAAAEDYYETGATVVRDSGEWQLIEHEFIIPPHFKRGSVPIYYWNDSQDSVWVDDLKIILKQY